MSSNQCVEKQGVCNNAFPVGVGCECSHCGDDDDGGVGDACECCVGWVRSGYVFFGVA